MLGGYLDLNQKVSPQIAKEKRKNSVGGMQWPFSSKVFLPSQYNMPMKSAAEENEQRNSVRASTLWPISNGSTLLDHNDKNLGNNWMKQATLSLGWSSSSIDAKPGGSSISPSTHAFMNGLPKTTSNFPRNNDKSRQLPASLTIFYSGSVRVYHGVSPETAEAIFSMASKEPSPMTGETKQCSKTVVVASEDIILQPSNAAAYPAEMTSAKFIAGGTDMCTFILHPRAWRCGKHVCDDVDHIFSYENALSLQDSNYGSQSNTSTILTEALTNAKPYNVTSEKKLHFPTPQSTTMSFNLLPMLLQEEGTGSSSNYS